VDEQPGDRSAEAAFQSIAAELLPEADVEGGTGFGANPGLRTRRKIFAMLHDGELVVKLPVDRCSELIAAGKARPFEIGRRTMREWVRIAEVDEGEWRRLARDARAYVGGGDAGQKSGAAGSPA
jgi:hypothetical protein